MCIFSAAGNQVCNNAVFRVAQASPLACQSFCTSMITQVGPFYFYFVPFTSECGCLMANQNCALASISSLVQRYVCV